MVIIEFNSSNAWKEIIERVLSKPAHTDVLTFKSEVPHPLSVGFVRHIGDLAGQTADYRLPLPDGRELHVKEYAEDYSSHWDNSSAVRNPLGHILRDTMWVFAIVAVLVVGAFIGGLWVASKIIGKAPSKNST